MANLFSSSIGRKFLMSISGLFLILFLIVHLTLNSFLILDWVFGTETGQMFNAGSHFMATNPFIKVIEPVLALGFAVHIIYSLIISFVNLRARGNQKYQSGNSTEGVEWASKNMLVLGIAIFAFLTIHIYDFYLKMRGYRDWTPAEAEFPFFGVMATGEDAYSLVNAVFSQLWIVVVYVIGSVALAFHLAHGFWSAFQTIGWNNTLWLKRFRVISLVVAWLIGGGFSIIAVAQFLFFKQ